jgi:hypothetical protein
MIYTPTTLGTALLAAGTVGLALTLVWMLVRREVNWLFGLVCAMLALFVGMLLVQGGV